jgi:DivIVA domain-containing protein
VLTALAVLAALAVLFAAGALITHEGEVLRDAPADGPDLDLPVGQLQPEDVPQLRFGLALRGYRMDEVDTTLARVAHELTARDLRIAELQQALAEVREPAVVERQQQRAEPEQAAWPEQEWPEVTSAVAESPGQVHAPTPAPLEDFFPEIAPPEPAVQGLPDATEDEAPPVSSFGLYDRAVPEDEHAPLGPPGVGFAASGGAPSGGV